MIARRTRNHCQTDDVIPVTRLLTTRASSRVRAQTRLHLFHSRGRQSLPATQANPTRPVASGDGDSCVFMCLLDVQHTDHANVFRHNIEQVVMYSCPVRMLLLPCSDFPNVELGPKSTQRSRGRNARTHTSNSLPSRMYPSLRPLCPGRLEMAAYRRPAPN